MEVLQGGQMSEDMAMSMRYRMRRKAILLRASRAAALA